MSSPTSCNGSGSSAVGPEDIFHAVRRVHERCRGAYAAVAMITGVGIVGFRDPHGIRPLVFGKRMSERGPEYVLASESVAIDVLGYKLVRDVRPGEAVFISVEGTLTTRECAPRRSHAPCIFEYVYLARPDSIIDGISVHKARMRMGEALARKVRRLWPEHDIDVVIPIPDTSRSAALQLAHELGIKYREGFIKNRYIPRTFIMPGQGMRRKSVRQKLNAIDLEFRGRNVMLVDDSIVRGTTCRQIIEMARDAGAKKVYFASAAPPVRHPNVYGIDMPSVDELIAYNRTVDEVARLIGADWLVYQDLEDLIAAAHKGNPEVGEFDASCFSGEYVTGDVSAQYLDRLAAERCDEAKAERSRALNSLVDLHDIA